MIFIEHCKKSLIRNVIVMLRMGDILRKKNGKIEEYVIYVTDWIFNNKAPSKDSINKLVSFASKEFKFDTVAIKEKTYITALVFSNLVVE